jgi:TonB-dependent SusC/RagA subfamily outer membrane receptor
MLKVFKDAASTSLYGSKAANGVVIITTKKEHLLKINSQ